MANTGSIDIGSGGHWAGVSSGAPIGPTSSVSGAVDTPSTYNITMHIETLAGSETSTPTGTGNGEFEGGPR